MIEQLGETVLVQSFKVVGWNPDHVTPKPAQPVYEGDDIIGFVYAVQESSLDVVLFEQTEFNQQERPNMIVTSPQMTTEEMQELMNEALKNNPQMIEFWWLALQSYTDEE